jgi:hypothetical protein
MRSTCPDSSLYSSIQPLHLSRLLYLYLGLCTYFCCAQNCFALRIFGTAIAISAFLNLLVPGAATVSPTLVIIVRICQGFVEVCALLANLLF